MENLFKKHPTPGQKVSPLMKQRIARIAHFFANYKDMFWTDGWADELMDTATGRAALRISKNQLCSGNTLPFYFVRVV